MLLLAVAAVWGYKFKQRVKSETAYGEDGRVANPAQSWQDQTEMRGQFPQKRPILRGVKEPVFETYNLKAKKGISLRNAYTRQLILDESRDPEIHFRTLKTTVPENPALKKYYLPYMHPHLTKMKVTHVPDMPQDLPADDLVRPHLISMPMNQAHALTASKKIWCHCKLEYNKNEIKYQNFIT